MLNIPPKTLQNALIFYIICIIIFTNGFFAVITLSRENIVFYQDSLAKATFFGRLLKEPSRHFFQTNSTTQLDIIAAENTKELESFRATLYDKNWWRVWGDPPRLSQEGFPASMEKDSITFRPGVPGETAREIYVAVSSGSEWLGTIGIGVPEIGSNKAYSSINQVILTTFTNIFLGIALAIFIAQIILRPISQLLEGIEAIKRGDYGQRVQVQGENELSALGQTFNLMAASLQEKIKEGLERNQMLDEKVQELWEIFELTKAMGFSLHLQQMLERFLEKAQTLSFSSYGQILLVLPESNRLESSKATSAIPPISKEEFEKSLQQCLKSSETIEAKIQDQTLLFIPLPSGRIVQGVLFLGKMGAQSYTEGVRRFLETIAPLGGSLIENARLYQHVVEMKDYVRNVLDSVDSCVATVDCDGRMVTVNESFGKLFNVSPQSLAGKPVKDFLEEIHDPVFSEIFERHALGKSSRSGSASGIQGLVRHETALHIPGREPRMVRVRSSRLTGAGVILGRVLIADDITSFKQFERRMYETEKWVVLGRLASSVAHEIRNPLVAIRSLVEVIGEDLKGEHAQHVKVVIGEVNRLNKVVEQLLHLSRPERTDLRDVCMNDLLDELFVLIRHEASRSSVTLKKLWSEEKVYGKIDQEKIKQAFLNVMLNAIQAMSQGGTLSINLLKSSTANGFGNEPPERFIQILFADEGEGIPQELIEKLFDPFFTTRYHGTGLGLAITKKIVDLHNGRIEITSKLGQGTVVSITLPQESPEDSEESQPS